MRRRSYLKEDSEKDLENLWHQQSKAVLDHDSVDDLTEKFNSFFIDKISNIRKQLNTKAETLVNSNNVPFHPPVTSCMTGFCDVSKEDVSKLVTCMSSATCELNPISTKLVTDQCHNTLLPVVANIVNESLSSGEFPSIFKSAHIKPLLKKPSPDKNILKKLSSGIKFVFR